MQTQPPKLTPEVAANPFPFYAALREGAPVQYVEALKGSYVLSRHADVVAALKNPALFSSAIMAAGANLPREIGEDVLRYYRAEKHLLSADPPLHTRLRTLVSRAFTPRRVAELEPRIRGVAGELLDAMLSREELDFMVDLAMPLPITIIAEMLGVEPERRLDFKRWSHDALQAFAISGLDLDRMRTSLRELHEYLEAAIERRRREPRNDLISGLIEASDAEGGFLTALDLVNFVRLLLVAGNETTTNLLGNSVVALLEHPPAWERLAAEPPLIPNAVEEMLRYDGPIHAISRVTTGDTEVAGHPIPGGSRVMLLLAAANRDPRRFPEPDRFDLARDAQGHVAFGHGIHFCLGAPLARLEARVAFEELFRRVRRIAFAPGQEGHLDWGKSFVARGLKSLRLRAERR